MPRLLGLAAYRQSHGAVVVAGGEGCAVGAERHRLDDLVDRSRMGAAGAIVGGEGRAGLVAMFHNRTGPAKLTTASVLPSGLNATEATSWLVNRWPV